MGYRSLRRAGSLLLLAAISACMGCTPVSFEHPLVEPAEAKPCPKLYGTYRSTNDDDGSTLYAHIGSAGEGFPAGFLRIITVETYKDPSRSPKNTEVVCFMEQIGDHYIIQLPLNAEDKTANKRTNWSKEWDEKAVTDYLVPMRATKIDDRIEFAFVSPEFLEEQINANKLKGVVKQKAVKKEGINEVGEKAIKVTADTVELRKFFAEHIQGKLIGEKPIKMTLLK